VLVRGAMFAYLLKILLLTQTRLKSRASLEAETFALRRQVIVPSRKSLSRVRLCKIDPLVLVWLSRCFPAILKCDLAGQARDRDTVASARLSTLLALEIPRSGGRPRIDREIRALIRRTNKENPLWGAPRIHGKLLMLGIEVAQSTVARYSSERSCPSVHVVGKAALPRHPASRPHRSSGRAAWQQRACCPDGPVA